MFCVLRSHLKKNCVTVLFLILFFFLMSMWEREGGGVIVSTIYIFLRVWIWVAYIICICLQKQNHLCSRFGWSEGRMDLASLWWTSFQSKWAELTSVSFHFHIFCAITQLLFLLCFVLLCMVRFFSLFFLFCVCDFPSTCLISARKFGCSKIPIENNLMLVPVSCHTWNL